jgi:hypothetical protein
MPAKETAEIETGMAEKFSWDQANIRQKLGLVWRNRKKISQIIKDYFYLPFFLYYFMSSSLLYCFLYSVQCQERFQVYFLVQFPDCGVQAAGPDSHGV